MSRTTKSRVPAASARFLVAILALLAAGVAEAAPPAETLSRITSAIDLLEGKGFVGDYQTVLKISASKPNGKTTWSATESTRNNCDGTRCVPELLSAERDGKDVTAARRKEREERRKKREKRTERSGDRKGSGPEIEIMVPSTTSASRYQFSSTRREGALCVADYQPLSGERNESLTAGTLSWDCASGDPARVKFKLLQPPALVKSFAVDAAFSRSGNRSVASNAVVDMTAGLAFFTRKIHMELVTTDLRER